MCGRYDNTIAAEAYRRLFGAERMPQSNFPQRYNVAPTDLVPIIRLGQDGQRELVMALGPGAVLDEGHPEEAFINARAERWRPRRCSATPSPSAADPKPHNYGKPIDFSARTD